MRTLNKRKALVGIGAAAGAWIFVISPLWHMQPIDAFGYMVRLSCGGLLGFLSAVIAKRFHLNPWMGFGLGFFLPGISIPILIYIGKRKGTI